MKASVQGRFRIIDSAGLDCTPRGLKERALLALLLFSPGRRRTRTWIQDKLWSDRSAAQASVSLRQSLAKIRRDMGPGSDCLGADRASVWLSSDLALEEPDPIPGTELLEDLDVRDPEFESWLRDLRQSQRASVRPHAPSPVSPKQTRPFVVILQSAVTLGPQGQFLTRGLVGRIAEILLAAGDLTVELGSNSSRFEPAGQDVSICIETLEDGPAWHVLVRVLGHPGNRCVWTGRLRLPLRAESLWESPEAVQLCNRSASAAIDIAIQVGPKSPFAAIQRAVRRIDDFDRTGIEAADFLLRGAQTGDATGVALAWRAFTRLTQALEYRETGGLLRDEALSFHREALQRNPDNPVILALSAQVQMKLVGDFDYSHFLARRAVEAGDQNPHALNMMSHHLVLQGQPEQGQHFAEAARRAATGLPNSFTFDIQGAFSALGLGQFAQARDLALLCHRKKYNYRPALRYLVGLNLLLGQEAEAQHYAQKLRQLEPDFTPALLFDPAYPFETFRRLGLLEAIRGRVG